MLNDQAKRKTIAASDLRVGDTIITPANEYDVDSIVETYGRVGRGIKIISGDAVSFFNEHDAVNIRAKESELPDDLCLDW